MHHRDDCPGRFVVLFHNPLFPKEMLQPRKTLKTGLTIYGCDGDYSFLESVQVTFWPRIIISSSKINHLFSTKDIYFTVSFRLSQIVVLSFLTSWNTTYIDKGHKKGTKSMYSWMISHKANTNVTAPSKIKKLSLVWSPLILLTMNSLSTPQLFWVLFITHL